MTKLCILRRKVNCKIPIADLGQVMRGKRLLEKIFLRIMKVLRKNRQKKWKSELTKSRKYSIIKKRRGVNAPLGDEPQRRRCRGRKEDTSKDRRNSRRIDLRDSEA